MGADPRESSVLRRIYEVRSEVRRRDARPNDGRCGNVTKALEAEFGWQGQSGYLRLLDGSVSWVHCWNRLDDSTIVDATADQYQGLWLGDVVILDGSNPLAGNYLHEPRKWELRFRRDSATGRVEHLECVFDSDVRIVIPDDAGRPWMSLTRGVLALVTGWELNDDLVGLAARALRGKASLTQTLSSSDLTTPLILASIQHMAKHTTPPWIAAEFREPL
jgi:hypothetical protein